MKALTKKVVEAGLVPAQVLRLMKLWRCVPEELHSASVEELTQEELLRFVEQISMLIEESSELPEMKETELDLQYLVEGDPRVVHAFTPDGDTIEMTVGITRSGQLVFPVAAGRTQEMICRRGNGLRIKDALVMITHVEPRYVGEELRFYLCDVVPADA